jgi:hypothetical protein
MLIELAPAVSAARDPAAPMDVEFGSIPTRDRGCGRPQVHDLIGEGVVSLNFASWNQLDGWLRAVEGLRRAA